MWIYTATNGMLYLADRDTIEGFFSDAASDEAKKTVEEMRARWTTLEARGETFRKDPDVRRHYEHWRAFIGLWDASPGKEEATKLDGEPLTTHLATESAGLHAAELRASELDKKPAPPQVRAPDVTQAAVSTKTAAKVDDAVKAAENAAANAVARNKLPLVLGGVGFGLGLVLLGAAVLRR